MPGELLMEKGLRANMKPRALRFCLGGMETHSYDAGIIRMRENVFRPREALWGE
jgi:hypothetical protein